MKTRHKRWRFKKRYTIQTFLIGALGEFNENQNNCLLNEMRIQMLMIDSTSNIKNISMFKGKFQTMWTTHVWTSRQNQLKSLLTISNLFQTTVSEWEYLILDHTQYYQILIKLIFNNKRLLVNPMIPRFFRIQV